MPTRKSDGGAIPLVRQQLGERLKALRLAAGKTHLDVQIAEIASPTKMWRIEKGLQATRVVDIWGFAGLYNIPPDVVNQLVSLASASDREGWWEEFDVPEWLSVYASREAAAARLSTYDVELVHGLLQTEDYARAVVSADGAREEEVKQRLAFRMARQGAVFDRPEPGHLISVMSAAALCLIVGSPETMQQQLEHLDKMATRPNVDIRILPWTSGPHPWMSGPFKILDFDDPHVTSLVHVESAMGARYLDRAKALDQYRKIHQTRYQSAVPYEEYRRDHNTVGQGQP